MSLRSRGVQRRGRVATVLTTIGALAAFQALAIVGAGAASAAGTCTYNPATDTINITIDLGYHRRPSRSRRPRPTSTRRRLRVRSCSSQTRRRAVAGVRQRVELEHRGDRRPRTAERLPRSSSSTRSIGDPFNTAIVWNIDLGTGAGDDLTFNLNDDVDNTVVLTNTTFTLNGAAGEVLGGSAGDEWNVNGGAGDDVLDASAVTAVFTDLFGGRRRRRHLARQLPR